MRIKELAKEIREDAKKYPDDEHDQEMVDQMLDLIGNAEELTWNIATPKTNWNEKNMATRTGIMLFFPDPQPTLKDAAQAVVEERMAALRSNSILDKRIDNLAAALKRED